MKLLRKVLGLTSEIDVTPANLGAATPGEVAAAIAAHSAAGDPHPAYLTQPEGDARYRLGGPVLAGDISGILSDGQIPLGIARDAEVSAAIAGLTPGAIGAATADQGALAVSAVQPTALGSYQPLAPNLTQLAGLAGVGLVERAAGGLALLAPGLTGRSLLSASTPGGAQAALGLGTAIPLIHLDNYPNVAGAVFAGGSPTSDRWIYVPLYNDNYTRLVVSRGYSEDSYAYGCLSAVIECAGGTWGSSGAGGYLKIHKINEYGWPGAFPGATNHLLREVRLLESSGGEVGYSGLWLRVAGARTYNVAGQGVSYAPLTAYASYPATAPPTVLQLGVLTPPGAGIWHRVAPNYYANYQGTEIVSPILTAPGGAKYALTVTDTGQLQVSLL